MVGGDGQARQVGGRYALLRRVDVGGGGSVYEAMDRVGERRVAAKRLHRRALARQEREISALRRLAVPGVVGLVDVVVETDGTWLIMEWVEGTAFPGPSEEPVPLPVLLETVAALLETLSAVHAQGLVHRDLKPDNVLVRKDGTPVLLDFGLARGSIIGGTLTREGSVVGTPGYLAPEQVNGGTIDGRTDLYAVGTMLFEVLADRLPLPSASTEELYARTVKPAPSLARYRVDLPRHIVETVDALLQIDPERRPASAMEVRSLLLHGRSLTGGLPWLGSRAPIRAVLSALADGRPASVGGAAGCGRTRVLREVVAVLEDRGVAVAWLRPGRRPFESLAELVVLGDGTEPSGVRAAVTEVLNRLQSDGLVLFADPLGALDPWTQRLVRERAGMVYVVDDGPATAEVAALGQETLQGLFHGPDLIVHLREDGAALLHHATGGVAARVSAVVRGWVRAGVAAWEDGRLRVGRQDLDRLALRLHGAAVQPQRGATRIRPELKECLRWIALAHPAASVGVLAQAMARPAWQVALEVEDLVAGAHVVEVDGRLVPVTGVDLRPSWTAGRRRLAHAALAAALVDAPEQRLHHLLAAGEAEQVAQVAAAVARDWLEQGRVGAAGAVLHEALLEVRARPHVPGEPLLLRMMLEVGVESRARAAVAAASVAIEQSKAPLALLRCLAGGAGLLEDGKWSEASRVLRPWPRHERGWAARMRGELLARAADQLGPGELEATVTELVGRTELWTTPEAQAWRMRWQGRLAFRRYEFRQAAALYRRSAGLCSSALERARSLRRAAEALREAGDWDAALALAQVARAAAEEARHVVEAASALLVERTVVARAGLKSPPRPELVDIMAQVGRPSLAGRVASVESWIAIRQGAVEVAIPLVARARSWAVEGGIQDAVLHCTALQVACLPEDADAIQIGELVESARSSERPEITLDILALLASVGLLPEHAQPDLEALAASHTGAAAHVRRGVYSPAEALTLARAQRGARLLGAPRP